MRVILDMSLCWCTPFHWKSTSLAGMLEAKVCLKQRSFLINDIGPTLLHICELLMVLRQQKNWSPCLGWSDDNLSSVPSTAGQTASPPTYHSYRKFMFLDLLIIWEFYRQGMPTICLLPIWLLCLWFNFEKCGATQCAGLVLLYFAEDPPCWAGDMYLRQCQGQATH